MTLAKIFIQPRYVVLAVAVMFLVVAVAAWLPNLHLITNTLISTSSAEQKLKLLVALLGSLQTNFTITSLVITIVTAGLTGIQASLLFYYLKQTSQIQSSMGMSVIGIVSSMLGIGCATCGSVILMSLIGLSSTSAVIYLLPFKGLEFGFLGIAILVYAISHTIKKINQPITCKIKEST